MRITWEEMQLLTGTDIVVQMIRCKLDTFDYNISLPADVLNYVKEYAMDMWCERDGVYYFASAVDRANTIVFCQEYVEENTIYCK